MNTLRAAAHLAAKDLRLYARDKGGLALGFLLPIALITVFAIVFGGMVGDDAMPKPKLRVVDYDRTAASRELVAAIKEQAIVRLPDETQEAPAPAARDELVARVEKGDEPLVFLIGKGFEADLKAGKSPPVELIRELSRTVEARIVEQALLAALMSTEGSRIGRVMTSRGVDALAEMMDTGPLAKAALGGLAKSFFDRLDDEKSSAASRRAAEPAGKAEKKSEGGFAGLDGMGAAFGLKTTVVGGDAAGGSQRERLKVGMTAQSVAGTAVMMLLFGLVACGTTLLQEKEEGTLRRLLASPVPASSILLGKYLYAFAIGVAQLLVMFAFGRVAFGLPVEKHLVGCLVFILATAAAATGFGVLLAVVGRSRKQVEGLSTLIVLVMSAIGGSWFPIFVMPEWMQTAAGFTLTGWAMKGFQGIFYYGKSLGELLPELAALCGLAAVLVAISTALFKRRIA